MRLRTGQRGKGETPGMDSEDKEIKKVVFATGNADKLREIREILSDLPVEVVSMKEAGFTGDIDENGETFADNAMIKAKTVCGALGCITLADDSGLDRKSTH